MLARAPKWISSLSILHCIRQVAMPRPSFHNEYDECAGHHSANENLSATYQYNYIYLARPSTSIRIHDRPRYILLSKYSNWSMKAIWCSWCRPRIEEALWMIARSSFCPKSPFTFALIKEYT